MPRSLGFLARTFFGLNGLLTVWCVGCCGFEPLVNASGQTMAGECAEGAAMGTSAEQAAPATSLAAADVATNAPDCGCACQSCSAVSAARFVFPAGASESPEVPPAFSDSLISASQEPLYPPPKVLPLRA